MEILIAIVVSTVFVIYLIVSKGVKNKKPVKENVFNKKPLQPNSTYIPTKLEFTYGYSKKEGLCDKQNFKLEGYTDYYTITEGIKLFKSNGDVIKNTWLVVKTSYGKYGVKVGNSGMITEKFDCV